MCETKSINGFETGRLLEPQTPSFNDKVYDESLVVFEGRKEAWLGMNARGGPWVYTSSGDDFGFGNWYPGQPNDDAHDCVYWGHSTTNEKWADHNCNDKKFFICEFV